MQVCVQCACASCVFSFFFHTHKNVAVRSTWLWSYQAKPVPLTSRGENELDLGTNAMDIWALLCTPTCGAHTKHMHTHFCVCLHSKCHIICPQSESSKFHWTVESDHQAILNSLTFPLWSTGFLLSLWSSCQVEVCTGLIFPVSFHSRRTVNLCHMLCSQQFIKKIDI